MSIHDADARTSVWPGKSSKSGMAFAESPRHSKRQPIAIKFAERDALRGMEILLRHGAARAYPGFVYIIGQALAERALPALREARVTFFRRDDLPARLTDEEARRLQHGDWREG